MDYKKIYFFFIFLFISITITSCSYTSIYSFFYPIKTIEIGDFSEEMNIHIPRRSISFDFKKNIENYILKHNPSYLALKDGDIILEGKFLDYAIIPTENYSLKKIQITVKICYKDNLEPEQNWEQNFIVSEYFYYKKNLFLEEIINKIIEKLTIQVYQKIFYENNNNL
ncbi:hypothetical protein [Blattabacterium cuenoti]|uniref:hypothetical protein n=1 Tax=Blattabacterium cuenoti TaxID=1653831 RepID=UPI00163CF8B4|nr:hypothetical protein [Blattabacterium cuenoti]